ncbi:capsid protein-like protein [Ovine gammaherpesvirus 2]|uniref:Capsid scaffolding protein n=2 Tax=Ovine gammaherpesvirus 2 TaxID=10398 RepID=A1BM05_9GAMA|nr:capsid protein-like protein [Ovine gammaherpesvirus 2]
MSEEASLHVAGFVDIAACPKSDPDLKLDAPQWQKHLPLDSAIPLTVEHLPGAQVGWVTGLFPVAQGLFCTGVINSPGFLDLLDCLYSECVVAQCPPNADLPRNPRAEVMHSWLPELSLSSVHPTLLGTDKQPPEVFQHVSLCALGKRRGSVAVYGNSLPWVLSRFKSLSSEDAAHVQTAGKVAVPPTPLEFNAPIGSLFAKAIDASFIRDRLTTLQADRHAAGVSAATYLKASKVPSAISDTLSPTSNSAETAPEKQLEATLPSTSSSTSTSTSTMVGAGAPTPAPSEDLIPVPRSAFLNMLESTVARMPQSPPQGPLPPAPFQPGMPYFASYNMACPPPGLIKHRKSHFLSPYEPEPHYPYHGLYSTPYPDCELPRVLCQSPCCANRSKKRAREESDGEASIFPGEEPVLYRKDFSHLSKSLAELQSEIRELKQLRQAPPQMPPADPMVPYYHSYHPQMAPQYAMYPPPSLPSRLPVKEPVEEAKLTRVEPSCLNGQGELKASPSAEAADESVAGGKGSIINASCQPNPTPLKTNTLQKLFCEELLTKQ